MHQHEVLEKTQTVLERQNFWETTLTYYVFKHVPDFWCGTFWAVLENAKEAGALMRSSLLWNRTDRKPNVYKRATIHQRKFRKQ